MSKPGLNRRQFLRGLAAAGLGSVAAVSGYASLFEPYSYELTETDIYIRDLPAAFENFRIAHVTDVHHSRIVSLAEVRRVVELTRAAKPDLIALTGDYSTSRRRYIEPCAEALSALEAPEGVWAVLGNHDHYNDAHLTARALKRARINLIDNANTRIRRGGDTLQLAGIGDWSWADSDWERTLRGIDRQRPSVLLSHEPIVLDMPETRGLSLVLSGHTHGGQIYLPLIGSPLARYWRDLRYLRGLYRRDETQLYVSRGTGMIGLPIRLGAPPEIAILKLKKAVTSDK
ncbi:MAG TPA: metallophosphoesterase [Pyrinomonadaceae bacterium]|jgi:hypothetical protein